MNRTELKKRKFNDKDGVKQKAKWRSWWADYGGKNDKDPSFFSKVICRQLRSDGMSQSEESILNETSPDRVKKLNERFSGGTANSKDGKSDDFELTMQCVEVFSTWA